MEGGREMGRSEMVPGSTRTPGSSSEVQMDPRCVVSSLARGPTGVAGASGGDSLAGEPEHMRP